MRIFTEEHKRKLRENHKGMLNKKHSENSKQKMRLARQKRRTFSEKQKQEISEKISKTHKNIPKSKIHKNKISESEKGKILSEETKRKISKANIGRLGMVGPANPNWKGGISCEPYCDVWLDKQYKNSIKERDNNVCQNCGIIKMLSLKVFSADLSIHHINYIKKDCLPNNLITICNSCNFKGKF